MNKRSGGVPREERLNSEFKKAIYEIIARDLNDPEICAMVSVTGVSVTKDLAHAKVFLSVYSKDAAKKDLTFKAIKKNAKKIRFFLASKVRVRTVPELDFILDESLEYGDKMDKLFLSLKKEGEENGK